MPPSAQVETSSDRPLTVDDVIVGLLDDRLIDDSRAERLRFLERDSQRQYEHPLALVAAQNWLGPDEARTPLDLERLTRWLAERVHLPYFRIDPLKVDVPSVTGVVKHAYATRFGILPVAVSGHRITIATAEPYIREWERELGKAQNLEFERVIANPRSIKRYLAEFYAISRSLSGAATTRASTPVDSIGNLEQLVELDKISEPDANDQHVVRIVDWLLQYAFEQRASDIHLEPRRDTSNVRFRIDGVLHVVNEMPAAVLGAVASRLKSLGRMDVIERRRPQDGRIKTKSPTGKEVELRLSTMPTTFGEKLVMRIFDPDVLIKSLADLGFGPYEDERWRQMVAQPYGMIVVTGPTGSGKTTTLYSALKRLARPELNVCTIEDPIELVDAQLNQMQVQPNIGLDFAAGVRTVLRQDPDIIMIGEIRDHETAQTAIQAALTGDLVLTTMHTSDSPSSVTRFLDLGVAPYLIKSSLLGVVAQRLVRTLCQHCKRRREITPDEWQSLVAPMRIRRPRKAFESRGCDECRHTGYLGRIGIFEIMLMSDPLRQLIVPSAEAPRLREVAIGEGMRSLRISGAEKVQRGLTTPAEIFNVV